MTSNKNVTSTDTSQKTESSLLWLPYVIIAVLCLVFLAINFWCYHRKHRQRYQRKVEVIETRERMQERRLIFSLVKSRYMVQYECDDDDNSSMDSGAVISRSSEFNKHSKNGIASL